MKKVIIKHLLILVSISILCGCHTTTYKITSNPSGAAVLVKGKQLGVTPSTISYSNIKMRTVSCTVKKDGYLEISSVLDPTGGELNFELELIDKPPSTFVRTMEATWASIQIRESLAYENAWNGIMEVLVRQFDLEVLSKENGYMRTGWLYTWTGEMREDYRVRVTVKINPERDKADVKSEANYRTKKGWILGSDTALLRTLKTDIMGTVGRTTR